VLAARVRAVAPAWRPGQPHTLAWVDSGGRVEVRDVDTGRVVWRSAESVGHVRELQWSADGRRLLARGKRRLVVLDVGANRVRRVELPSGARVTAVAWAPRGRRLAITLRTGATSRVVVTASADISARPAFAAPGTLTSLAWSPDASRLLVRWRESDQWLLLSPTRARVTAIAAVSHRFGATPTVRGWCCG
jgi:tricorn protease-like protein